MNQKTTRAGASALLVLMAGSAPAGELLRYKGNVGDGAVYQLKLGGTTTVFRGEDKGTSRIGSEVFLTQRVEQLRKDGSLGLSMTVNSARATVNGAEDVLPYAGQVTRTELAPNGALRGAEAAKSGLDLSQLQLVFPDEPVEVGTKWSREAPASATVPVALKTTYEIVGFEKIGDLDCVKIHSQVQGVGPAARAGLEVEMKADGVIHFAFKEGFMVENQVHAELNMAFEKAREPGLAPEKIAMESKLDVRMAYQYQEDRTAHGDE